MNTKPLVLNAEFENDTYYLADKDFFEVSLSDTIHTTHSKYFYNANNSIREMDVCVLLKGKKNITLDFGGATLFLRGKIQPFIIDECENITIKNVRVEYERGFTTELEIIERTDDYVTLKPNPLHPCRIENNTIISYCDSWVSEPIYAKGTTFLQTFDKETLKGCGLLCTMIGKNVTIPKKTAAGTGWKVRYMEEVDGNFRLIGWPDDAWQVGRILAFTTESRYRSSVFMFDSYNLTIDGYQIVNGSAMGFFPIHCKDLFFKNIKLLHDEKSTSIIQNTADAIHAVANSGRFEIHDSVFSGMIDDGFNIHAAYYLLESYENNVAVIRSDGWVSTNCNGIDVGDTMAVHKPGTIEQEATYSVIGKEILDKYRIRVTLDRTLENHAPESLIENLTANPDVVVKNTKFIRANSHLRLQTRGKVLVEDCETELPILLSGDAVYWFEASPCKDVTIRNVKFLEDRANIRFIPEILPTEKEPYYHENILIENCSFVSALPVEGRQGNNIKIMGCTNVLGLDMETKLVNFGDIKSDCVKIKNTLVPKKELNYDYR